MIIKVSGYERCWLQWFSTQWVFAFTVHINIFLHQFEAMKEKQNNKNTILDVDLPLHCWYRFVLSFPPHLVRKYLSDFRLSKHDVILDPFCGTGTTIVEAKKNGIPSIGCDAHPLAVLASRVKTHWGYDLKAIASILSKIVHQAERSFTTHGLLPITSLSQSVMTDLPSSNFALNDDENEILPNGFISDRPLRRILILRNEIENETSDHSVLVKDFFLLALANVIANGACNFAHGPEIYRKKSIIDYDVLTHFSAQVNRMCYDLKENVVINNIDVHSQVFFEDARLLSRISDGISAVITSPPYPNEKDYTRTTRVESILLGLITSPKMLRSVKNSLIRSNTRNTFAEDRDAEEVKDFQSIQKICQAIEERRNFLRKTSGFERLYHKVVAHYFGGMRLHFRSLHARLREKAQLAYVVGDQLSYLMVHIPTARILSEIAESEGFRIVRFDHWRNRQATRSKYGGELNKKLKIREEVLILERS